MNFQRIFKFASQSFSFLSIEVFLLFVGEAAGFTEEEVDKRQKHEADERVHEKEDRVALLREEGLQRGNQEDNWDLSHCLNQHDDHEGGVAGDFCQVDCVGLFKEQLYRSERQNAEGLECRVELDHLKKAHKEVANHNYASTSQHSCAALYPGNDIESRKVKESAHGNINDVEVLKFQCVRPLFLLLGEYIPGDILKYLCHPLKQHVNASECNYDPCHSGVPGIQESLLHSDRASLFGGIILHEVHDLLRVHIVLVALFNSLEGLLSLALTEQGLRRVALKNEYSDGPAQN